MPTAAGAVFLSYASEDAEAAQRIAETLRGGGTEVWFEMRVECARCGHAEAETFEFDMPRDSAEPMEEYVPGTCPDCGATIHMHLKRTQQRE